MPEFDGALEDLDELASLVDDLAERVRELRGETDEGSAAEEVDSSALSGPSGQAQENRAIHVAHAQLATERARRTRASLQELVDRTRSGLDRVRRQQQSRRASGRPAGAGRAGVAVGALDVAGDVDAALRRVVRGAVAGVPEVEHATVSWRDGRGHVVRSAGSDQVAEDLISTQTRIEQGPCLDAARDARIVECADMLSPESPWPYFGPIAAGLGALGVLAVPVRCGDTTGTLSLWAARAGTFPEATRALAELFAEHARLAVVHAVRAAEMEQAIDRRDVIGQAKGTLMVRHGVDADEAFGILRQRSQDTNVKIVDVARLVVEESPAESGPA